MKGNWNADDSRRLGVKVRAKENLEPGQFITDHLGNSWEILKMEFPAEGGVSVLMETQDGKLVAHVAYRMIGEEVREEIEVGDLKE